MPALCDDGASFNSSCCKSLSGALLHTFDPADAGSMTIGDEDSGYSFVFDATYGRVMINNGERIHSAFPWYSMFGEATPSGA